MTNPITQLQRDIVPNQMQVFTQSGAIGISQGLVIINSPSAPLALTLAAPSAGPQTQAGMDGVELRIIVVASAPLTAQVAHTITCPANTVNGLFSTITFVPETGESISLFAYNGKWWKYVSSAGLS